MSEVLGVSERWKMRDGRIARVTHRQGDCCAGEVESSLLPMLWNAGKCQSGRRYDLVEQIATTPSIEQMKTEACTYMLRLLVDMGHGGLAGAILGESAIKKAKEAGL